MTPSLIHFVILALAVYRIARLFVEDALLEPFRNWVWKRHAPESSRIGYLLTCYWCLSFWISLVVSVCYILNAAVTIPVALILALSAVAGIISTKLDS